ncbi:MAG: hypothetical protein RII27_06265, partial [Alphaproteobacteria bacterium]
QDDTRDLVNQLFATATAMLEDASDIAVAGQSSRQSLAELMELADQLNVEAEKIATIARAARVIAAG